MNGVGRQHLSGSLAHIKLEDPKIREAETQLWNPRAQLLAVMRLGCRWSRSKKEGCCRSSRYLERTGGCPRPSLSIPQSLIWQTKQHTSLCACEHPCVCIPGTVSQISAFGPEGIPGIRRRKGVGRWRVGLSRASAPPSLT